LSILAIGIGFRVSIEARLARYNMDRIKALYLAKAGIVKACEVLKNDNDTYDWLYQCGVTLNIAKEETPDSIFSNIPLGEGTFSVGYRENNRAHAGMSDEERKININMIGATGTGQTAIPKEALENLLSDYSNKTDIAAAILAWRDPKKDMDLTKDSAYDSLGYERKGGDFSAVEELLLVDGMTPEIYNSIRDHVTVYGEGEGKGKVNINTASERVLRALFGCNRNIIDPGQVAAYVASVRNAADSGPWSYEAQYITDGNIDRVLADAGIINTSDREIVKNYFTMHSDYFRIESEGTVARSGIKKKAIAVVDRRKLGDNKLLYYREY
jgi:type II secretory pathway component PulK